MKTVSDRQKFIWNMLGSLSNACSTVILTVCVNRILGGNSGGLFSFAYANAQLMLIIGLFEVRPYQSTDIEERYSFNAYFSHRIVTSLLMLLAAAGYVLINRFNYEKSAVVFLLAMFKAVEAFTDVYGARFQQKDRIDLSGKLFFVRVVVSACVFVLLIFFTKNLVTGSLGMFLTSFILFFVYDNHYTFEEDKRNLSVDFSVFFKITLEVLPAFVSSFILMYLSNAAKYAINDVYGDAVQNIYGIISMPMFVINLISMFIFNPLLIKMAYAWKEGKWKKMCQMIFFVYGVILTVTVFAAGAAALAGIPVLSLLYGVRLDAYHTELVLAMLVGSLSAFTTYLLKVIAVIRKQKYMMPVTVLAFFYAFFCSEWMVKGLGIKGAILSYGISQAIIVILLNVVVFGTMLHKRKEEKHGQ